MISIKTPSDIDKLRQAGKLLAQVLKKVSLEARPGVSLTHLDDLAGKMILAGNARPAFKGYESKFSKTPFPATLCASVNDEVVHGPATRAYFLKNGDIVGLDLGLQYEKLYVDSAITVPVGKATAEARRLIKVTRDALKIALEQVKPGNFVHDISAAVQNFVEGNGYSVVRDMVGHGVGYEIHEDPRIPNFIPKSGQPERVKLEEGMVLAIEPMVNSGNWQVKTKDDGWTVVTLDGSWAAHFEHTVAVTKDGCEILTRE